MAGGVGGGGVRRPEMTFLRQNVLIVRQNGLTVYILVAFSRLFPQNMGESGDWGSFIRINMVC